MTLIIGMINRAYVLQVADRLVTRPTDVGSGPPRFEPFDELANKCVIYAATDAVVSISYTGVAFVLGKPTDVWLAEALDADIAAGPHAVLRSGGGSERRMTLGAAVSRVASRLTDDLNVMPARKRGDGVTFQLVGWQWRRRRLFEMPMMWHVRNDGTGAQTTVHRLPRYWGWERNQYGIKAVGDRRSDPEASVKRKLEGRSDLYADFVEDVLVSVIREASQSELTEGKIGADCIAVCIRLSDQCIRVRYLPASPVDAAYDVYTPWLIVPTVGASAPSVMSGVPATAHLGGLEVAFERAAPPGPTSLPASMTSMDRPADP